MHLLLLFACAQTLFAQPFTIKSYTIGAPGGSSGTRAYSLSGAAAHDAVDFTSRAFAINGGFWEIAAAPKGPKLRIIATGRNVLIAWPDPSTGFRLQQSKALSPAAWIDVTAIPRVDGAEKQVLLPIQPGTQFFRLQKEDPR